MLTVNKNINNMDYTCCTDALICASRAHFGRRFGANPEISNTSSSTTLSITLASRTSGTLFDVSASSVLGAAATDTESPKEDMTQSRPGGTDIYGESVVNSAETMVMTANTPIT